MEIFSSSKRSVSATPVQIRKPVVLHILYSGLGGHGNVFFSMVDADQKKEFSYYALFSGVEPLKQGYESECLQKNIPFTYISKKPGPDLRSYRSILAALGRVRPDIIFLHGSSFILPALIYKLKTGPCKIVVRDTQAPELKKKPDWLWLTWSVLFADRLVFLTAEAAKSNLVKIGWLIPRSKVKIIANGLDLDKYPRRQSSTKSEMVIGMQSRLQRIKDHSTLLEAFRLLAGKIKDQQLKLRIAGEGETLTGLKALAVQLGVADKTEFCGMLAEQDLQAFMLSLDLYVHASFGETMSTSIMQAMACSLPVIASDVAGINNMVDGTNGILVPVRDAKALATAMEMLLLDEEKRRGFARNARMYAEQHLSAEKMFAEYKKLFYSLHPGLVPS